MNRNRFTTRLLRTALAAAAVVSLTAACDLPSTCYGREPDGEIEAPTPCPSGWQPGETRDIAEDEFADMEWDD